MPIRKDLLPLYKTPEYKHARERIKARAGDCCEQCGKPNGARVETSSWRNLLSGRLEMVWRGVGLWHNHLGREQDAGYYLGLWPGTPEPVSSRFIRVVLTVAHLDHTPGRDVDDNLKLLCQWCHLHHDLNHHAETRSIRKDRERPLLTTP